MEKLTLAIEGMSCAHCVARVRQTLAAAPGVQVNDVSVGGASLSYDADATTPEAIADAVSAVGYPAGAANAGASR
jgi:copper chaperone CopZ